MRLFSFVLFLFVLVLNASAQRNPVQEYICGGCNKHYLGLNGQGVTCPNPQCLALKPVQYKKEDPYGLSSPDMRLPIGMPAPNQQQIPGVPGQQNGGWKTPQMPSSKIVKPTIRSGKSPWEKH